MVFGNFLLNCIVAVTLVMTSGLSDGAPRVKKSSETKEKEKVQRDESVLYKVSLSEGTERSKIFNYAKNRVKFSSETFTQPVRKYDVFLVLNDALDGVLAEIVVVRVRGGRKLVYAKKSRIQDNLKLRDLVGKTVIRLDDLGDVLGSILVYRRNPVLDLSLSGSTMILTSANVATGIDLDPQVLAAGASITMFAPASEDIGWLNWLGYSINYTKFKDSKITIKTAKNQNDQSAVFSGDRKEMAVLLQPWFDYWIYQATIMYGLRHEKNESVNFTESSESGEDIVFKLGQKAGFLGLGFGVNPVHNLYGGVLIKTMASQKFTVTDSSTGEENEGFWGMKSYGAYASWIHGFSYELKLSLRFDISLREDSITKAQEIGSGNDHKITDWQRSVSLGIQYAP